MTKSKKFSDFKKDMGGEVRKFLFIPAILAILVIAYFIGCATQGAIRQPIKQSQTAWELSTRYPEFKSWLKGETAYQDLPPEIQRAYIDDQTYYEVTKLLVKSKKISGDQVMQHVLLQRSVPEIKRVIEKDPTIPTETRESLISEISTTESKYDLQVPREASTFWVWLQTHGPVADASSELFALVNSREEFILNFQKYINIAKNKNRRLIITASTTGEAQWLHNQIRYRGEYLKPTLYKDLSQTKIYPGAEVPLD